MRNLLDRLLSTVRNILSFADPRYHQHFDWDPTQGGGGGSYTAGDGIDITSNTIRAKVDGNTIQFNTNGQLVASVEGGVTKEYVDNADQNLQDQIDERVEKDTGTGQWVYTSEDGATVMKNISNSIDTSTASIPNNKAVKDYVDGELEDKADKATTLAGYGITDAYTKTETDTELDKKLDKRTTGVEVYSHSDATQGAFTVKTEMSSSASDSNILTEKAIKDFVKYSLSGGKIKLAGGLEIVYGNGSVSSSGTDTKNFPTAFTNACLTIVASPAQPGYGQPAVLHCKATSKSQYQVSQSDGVANMGYNFIAIGY